MRANEEKIFPMPDYSTRYRNNNHRGGCKSQQYYGENPTNILVNKCLWSCLPTRIIVVKAPVSCWDLHRWCNYVKASGPTNSLCPIFTRISVLGQNSVK